MAAPTVDEAVEHVSWDDAASFIARLNAQNDGYSYSTASGVITICPTAMCRKGDNCSGKRDSLTN